jgi:Methyltransferase domain
MNMTTPPQGEIFTGNASGDVEFRVGKPALAKRVVLRLPGFRRAIQHLDTTRRIDQETTLDLRDLNAHLGFQTLKTMEDYIDPNQAKWLRNRVWDAATDDHDIAIAQTGFNGGHSAAVMLGEGSKLTVTSFDIGEHEYVQRAQDFIHQRFNGRHTLVTGDSKQTLVDFEPVKPFGMVFVDGGHDYKTARADLENFARLSLSGATVIMDDYLPHTEFGIGPYIAWNDLVGQGLIEWDGEVFRSGHGRHQRAWVMGKYSKSIVQ